MSKKIFLDSFFSQFSEFLTQLETLFPEDPDFPTYRTGMSMLQRMNPGMVISEFKEHVFPFEKVIRAKNSDFFMNYAFSEINGDNTMEEIIKKLKNMWATLSDGNKEAIWKYIILLVDLAQRC